MTQPDETKNDDSLLNDGARALADLINRIESDPTPIEDYRLEGRFSSLRRELATRDSPEPPELEWEEIAFLLDAASDDNDACGIYYGQTWQQPALERVTLDTLAYWRQRATSTRHPVLRARYADLLWELPKSGKIAGARPDPDMGRLAVDSYTQGISENRFGHDSVTATKAQRALDIGLTLRDVSRIAVARDTLLALDERIAKDELPGLWIGFDTFIEPPNKSVELSAEWQKRLLADMEGRLARLSSGEASQYHPAAAEAAALRLATHYRRHGRRDEVARVLRTYTAVVTKMRGAAAALVQSHSLALLYAQLKAFDLHEDADALNEDIRIAGEGSLEDLKEISVEGPEISEERVEQHFAALLAGSAVEVLKRIAAHYIPNRSEVEIQLRSLAQSAPLSFLMPHAILDHLGRTVAHVGPLETDLEGNVIRQLDQNLRLAAPWLRETMRRALANGVLTADDILNFLLSSPAFAHDRRSILEEGIRAYQAGESIATIHILVPQIEAAIRSLATLIQAPIYTQRRGGGFHARLLDEFLRDENIVAVLTDNASTYLRALLSDQRGWNIRNDITHGLAPVGMMNIAVADRVLHALLVFGLLRARPNDGPVEQTQNTPPDAAT